MIQYKYALNENHEAVNINSVNEELRKSSYFCLACNNELIPRMGKQREWHFAHKYIQNCSGETYLHILGKKIFKSIFEDSLLHTKPFGLIITRQVFCNKYQEQYDYLCDLGIKEYRYDLTKYFDEIFEEKKDNGFIPDLLLKNSKTNKKIYLEIAVHHQSTIDKINSKERIIEYQISSEEDLEIMYERKIEQSSKITLYNFQDSRIKNNFCNNKQCKKEISCFILYKSGKSLIISIYLYELDYFLKKNKISYFNIIKEESHFSSSNYVDEVVRAYKSGQQIKNCYLCRYHAINYMGIGLDDAIYCKFLKTESNSNNAADCKYFRADPSVFSKIH